METVAPVNPRRGRDNLTDDIEVTFVPMAAVEAETGRIDVSARKPIGSARKGFTRFGSNDVIFAKITPCMENGKIAVIPDLPHGVGFGSTEFHVLAPRDISSRYLYHWLSQGGFRETAEFNMTGTAGQKRVPTDFMRDALVPVPPRPVQDVIVARIDELFAEIDDGEAALARARHDLATWRKALLKAAVTGELTADWRAANPPAETGADLLARILADRRARWETQLKGKGKEYAAAPSAPADLRELPEGWTWATLGQLTTVVTSGSRAWSSYYDRGHCTFIMAQNVRPGRFDPTFRQLVDPPEGDAERARTAVKRNDLLLTIVGANTGDLCRFNIEPDEHYVCQSVALLRLGESSLAGIIEAFFNNDFGRRLQMENMIYGAGRPHLSFDQIKEMAVPVPPEAERLEIDTILERVMSEAGAGSDDIAAIGSMPATLRQSILAAAFRGELA